MSVQGAREAQERAQAAVQEGEEAVAQVQKEYRGAVAEVGKLVEERQRWQEAWDAERQRMEADKVALAASMEVSCLPIILLSSGCRLCTSRFSP